MNIFLLRGLVRERKHWDWFKEDIKKKFPSANIILLEIPGVGETHKMISPDNFKDMIDFMRNKHTDHLQQKENNILIAMSLGGMISRVWLDLYPNDFSKIVLINTSFKGITPLFKRLKPLSILRFFKIFFTFSIQEREKQILEMVSNDKTAREKLLPDWVRIHQDRPVQRSSFLNQMKAALTSKVSIEMPKDVELLILAGKADKLCNYESSLLLHKAWGGEIQINETAGHDLPIDAPEWLVNTIEQWVNKK